MTATVTRFPKALKRGRKVTRGPCAQVLSLGSKNRRELYIDLLMMPRVPHPDSRKEWEGFVDEHPRLLEQNSADYLAARLRERREELREYLGL